MGKEGKEGGGTFFVAMQILIIACVSLVAAEQKAESGVCDSSSTSCPAKQENMSPKDFVEAKIKEGPVVVFSKTYCAFCKATKKLFSDLGVEIIVIELDIRDDGQAIQDYLLKKTGGRSVPRVFVGGNFVGGSDQTAAVHDKGELVPLIEKAGGTVNQRKQLGQPSRSIRMAA